MSQEFLNQVQNVLSSILNVFQVVATFLIAFLVVLWMTLCFWTFRDIQSRTRDIIAQIFATLLVFFFNIPGVLLYILVRPKETLEQSYERNLQEEYMLQDLEEREICPTCRVKTQPDFLFCFNCRTRLRRECSNCGQLVKLKWASCPFCGTPQKAKPRDTGAERYGLGAPRTNTHSQPLSTALATTPTGTGNLARSPYAPPETEYNPAIGASNYTSPTSGGRRAEYADGGERHEYNQETSYNYQPEQHYNGQAQADGEGLSDEELTAEIAPELAPDAPYDQPTRRYQPRRRRNNGANRNDNTPRNNDDSNS
ncbi:MAG TPA: zinc ribbon domain-containing protein [Chloroflexia bacterium]|nr:zinc ribbon domain-containing protein [Chloroflexia bacterium]